MSSLVDTLSSLLPQDEGILPKWLLFVSIISVLNSIQAYSTLTYTRRVYSGTASPGSPSPSTTTTTTTTTPTTPSPAYPPTSPVSPLSARTFGTWTLLSSIIRLYAAYNISNPVVYQLALWTYVIAWGHFVSEWLVFGTARWGAGLAGPVVVATGSLVWMTGQWGFYVR